MKRKSISLLIAAAVMTLGTTALAGTNEYGVIGQARGNRGAGAQQTDVQAVASPGETGQGVDGTRDRTRDRKQDATGDQDRIQDRTGAGDGGQMQTRDRGRMQDHQGMQGSGTGRGMMGPRR